MAASSIAERVYSAEVRERGEDGSWTVTETYGETGLNALAADYPSPGWSASATRILDLKRGDHVRVELRDDLALLLRRL